MDSNGKEGRARGASGEQEGSRAESKRGRERRARWVESGEQEGSRADNKRGRERRARGVESGSKRVESGEQEGSSA